MLWHVRYHAFGDDWFLNFPPQWLNPETENFDEFVTMGDVLAEAIDQWLRAS